MKFADENQKLERKILENSQLIFQARPRMEYSLNIHLRNFTYKHSMEFCEQTSPHCVVSLGCSECLVLQKGVYARAKERRQKHTKVLEFIKTDARFGLSLPINPKFVNCNYSNIFTPAMSIFAMKGELPMLRVQFDWA